MYFYFDMIDGHLSMKAQSLVMWKSSQIDLYGAKNQENIKGKNK